MYEGGAGQWKVPGADVTPTPEQAALCPPLRPLLRLTTLPQSHIPELGLLDEASECRRSSPRFSLCFPAEGPRFAACCMLTPMGHYIPLVGGLPVQAYQGNGPTPQQCGRLLWVPDNTWLSALGSLLPPPCSLVPWQSSELIWGAERLFSFP